ncbi:hypothetical protein EVAR_45902_1 [Eumeta japonica]|uniref:Uncharacterized protein n=1 Tax=Eumeta variegata TaxID=151549 RepID=A0A4C1XQ54_EUMVA|nr:hypothetical protein EVAR_45902_1 [Eumeta japonica]
MKQNTKKQAQQRQSGAQRNVGPRLVSLRGRLDGDVSSFLLYTFTNACRQFGSYHICVTSIQYSINTNSAVTYTTQCIRHPYPSTFKVVIDERDTSLIIHNERRSERIASDIISFAARPILHTIGPPSPPAALAAGRLNNSSASNIGYASARTQFYDAAPLPCDTSNPIRAPALGEMRFQRRQ